MLESYLQNLQADSLAAFLFLSFIVRIQIATYKFFLLFSALLADNGIDDDSALKISNLAALPHGMPASAGANVAIKAKITSNANAQVDESADHPKVSNTQGGFDPNAYLYDANSWPEYSIHDSDYSNFHAVEMSNMNGENTDMPPMYNIPGGTGSRNMGSEGGMEYPGGQRFPQGKTGGPAFNDEMKEAKGEALQKRPGEESNADKPSKEMNRDNSGEGKSDDDSGSNGVGKSQGSVKPQAEPVQPPPQKPDHANDPAAQEQQQTQPQQQQQQRQQQIKEAPRKQSPSIVQAAASLPPKSIASLVSSLVGGGKTVEVPVGQGEGQIQKNIDGTIAHSLISQDSNPAAEVTQSATELHKIARPKKH